MPTSRNPEFYTVGIPQFFFYQVTNPDDDRAVDVIALWRAQAGIVDLESGCVTNADDVSTCLTPEQIMEAAYIGNITQASMGGEVTSVEHTASVEGRKEVDKQVLTRRSLQYTLGFDEPNKQNIKRYFSAQSLAYPAHRSALGKTTASGNQSAAADFVTGNISIVDNGVTAVGDQCVSIEEIMTNTLLEQGASFSPVEINKKDVYFASVLYFLVADSQRFPDIDEELKPYRNKILCGFFKYDPALGKLKIQAWPAGMDTPEYAYSEVSFDSRLRVYTDLQAETIVGVRTHATIIDRMSASGSMENVRWAFNEGSPASQKLTIQLAEKVLPGTVQMTITGKRYSRTSGTWSKYSESLADYTQFPDTGVDKTTLRTADAGASAAVFRRTVLRAAALAEGTPAATWGGALTGDTSGSVTGAVTCTLTGQKDSTDINFVADVTDASDFTPDTHYTITGVPAGLTAKLTKTSATVATLTLTGTATDPNTAATIGVTFLDAALANGVTVAEVDGINKADIGLMFPAAVTGKVTWGNTLSGAADGNVTGNITATLSGTGAAYAAAISDGTELTVDTHYEVTGVPTGLTAKAVKTSSTVITVTLEGTADTPDDTNMTVTLKDAVLETGIVPGNIQNLASGDQLIDFAEPGVITGTLAWDGAFVGGADGQVTGSITATLSGTGAKFAVAVGDGTEMVKDTHYTLTPDTPEGLTLKVTKTSESVVTLSYTGTSADFATFKEKITFLDAAFEAPLTAVNVTGHAQEEQTIVFDVLRASITWTNNLKGQTDQSVSGFLVVELGSAARAGGVKFADAMTIPVKDTHFACSGVPAGLTVVAAKDGDNKINFSLSGTATTGTAATMTFQLLQAAFEPPLLVANVNNVENKNVALSFTQPDVQVGSYFTTDTETFIEYAKGQITLTANPQFIADSGTGIGGMPTQDLTITVSYYAATGKDAIWTGITWAQADDFLAAMRVNRGRSEVNGCALVWHQNDVGVSMVHAIPKAVLRPDGTIDFAKDDWEAGSFVMDVIKDNTAVMPNLPRRLKIPFGITMTYKYRKNDY